MTTLDNQALNLHSILINSYGRDHCPSFEVIKTTMRKLIGQDFLDPEIIIEEISYLPKLHMNDPDVILTIFKESTGYKEFTEYLQKLKRKKKQNRWLFEIWSVILLITIIMLMFFLRKEKEKIETNFINLCKEAFSSGYNETKDIAQACEELKERTIGSRAKKSIYLIIHISFFSLIHFLSKFALIILD